MNRITKISAKIAITFLIIVLMVNTCVVNVQSILASNVEAIPNINSNTPSLPSLTLEKSDVPDPVNMGSILRYDIRVSNDTLETLTNVVILENYDTNTTFLDSSPPPDSGTDNRWSFPSMGVGEFMTITVRVTVHSPLLDGTILVNTVSFTSEETVPIEDTEETTVIGVLPDLAITKTAAPSPDPAVWP